MLRKRTQAAKAHRPAIAAAAAAETGVSRRTFLRNSGLAAGGIAGISALGGSMVKAQEAGDQPVPQGTSNKKTVCPFCAVGCSIWAEVDSGVWVGQEPAFESPINLGTHCAKGAATREVSIGERRLKYPTKLEGGKWKRISWEQAIDEIGDKLLEIREQKGPDAVYWLGSAKFSNEMAYLHRKFAALWGTNNTDHQARICHSTTVAGVANSYGYGAMTNTFNDMHNSKSIFLLGGNPAEAHPVSMQHLLRAKENGAKFIVVDPRFTRTAAHADEYVRVRAGTDVAFLWGVLHHILEQGWEDEEYIQQRVWGFDRIREEVKNYPPDKVANITGVPEDQIRRVAEITAQNRPGTLIWCMGLTQSTVGNNKTRAASIFQLALGNIGKSGGGANIFRGHDNVQGATDLGVLCDNLPGYYGLSDGAWKHWSKVWDLDYEWVKSRFASKDLMELKGMPVSRWFDGVLEQTKNLEQPNNVGAMIFWGHAPNSQSRGPDQKKAMEKLDLMVIVDPVPTLSAVMSDRTDGVYLLPAGTTMEIAGSVTNSNRSLQWREKVIDPIFEAKGDYEIAYLFARKLGFAEQLFKHIAVEDGEPVPEDILRELNRGMWTIGYTGQSPERLKLHMENQHLFDPTTLIGTDGPVKGEYYGLPWPCWGTPEMKHPGTPLLYDESKPVAEGGLPFRARWGVEHEGENLLAENSYTPGSLIEDGYPEITVAILAKLKLLGQLSPREQLIIVSVAKGDYHPGMLEMSDDDASAEIAKMPEFSSQQVTEGGESADQIQQQFSGMSKKSQAAIEAYLDHQDKSGGGKSKDKSEEQAQQDGEQSGDGQSQQSAQGNEDNAEPGEAEFSGGDQSDGEQQGVSDGDQLREKILQVNWKTDLSGGLQRVAIANGLAPFGNGKARAVVWNFPDPVPVHREPLYTPRRDLIPEYKTYEDRNDFRLPVAYWSIQKDDYSVDYPLVMTSGRLVEYEGGGDETRANKWLAEFQQEMFAEVNSEDADKAGISDGNPIWVYTPEGARIRVAAMVTNRVDPGTVFMPFHFGGMWMGQSLADKYPDGTVPYVTGEAVNTAWTYGYDVVTFMQETKASLCRIEAA